MLAAIISPVVLCTLFGLGHGIPNCPQLSCPTNCTTKYELTMDANGCPECVCAEKICGPLPPCINTAECSNGFKKVDGCITPSCECNTNICPNLQCWAKGCKQGFAKDNVKDACPTCDCARGGRTGAVECSLPPCAQNLKCPPGQEQEKINGCPTCKCIQATPCKKLTCNKDCYFGSIDYDGCPSCDCRPIPITCPNLNCPRSDCHYGFAADGNGCPTCQCYRNPQRNVAV